MVRGTRDVSALENDQGNWLPIEEMSLGILLIGEPQGSWGSPVAKGGRAGLEDLGLVGTPLPRPAVASPASWPRALPDPPPPSTPSLRGVGARSHC